MASRKTAAREAPARGKATAARAGAKKSAPAKKVATAKTTATAKKATAAKKPAAAKKAAAAGKAPARRPATREAVAAGPVRKAGKPSARASKKEVIGARAARAKAGPAPAEAALAAARVAAAAALDKKAEDVVVLDVRGLAAYADYFVVASGTSDRQVTAIADAVEEKMKKAGYRTIGVEGYTRGHWVLLDFGDVVVHVFYDEARAFYDIEGLWADAARVPLE